ncbi:MAG: hypothetical protein Q8S17_14360, partial [Humidesulfovibrio sp.]|nr:hypothetical protein [Humidesulfovibrio sp.]
QALLDLERLREAWQMFEKCTRFEDTASEALLGLAQMAYQLRDYAKLAEQARRIAACDAPRPLKPDPLSLFEFWAGVGRVEHG